MVRRKSPFRPVQRMFKKLNGLQSTANRWYLRCSIITRRSTSINRTNSQTSLYNTRIIPYKSPQTTAISPLRHHHRKLYHPSCDSSITLEAMCYQYTESPTSMFPMLVYLSHGPSQIRGKPRRSVLNFHLVPQFKYIRVRSGQPLPARDTIRSGSPSLHPYTRSKVECRPVRVTLLGLWQVANPLSLNNNLRSGLGTESCLAQNCLSRLTTDPYLSQQRLYLPGPSASHNTLL